MVHADLEELERHFTEDAAAFTEGLRILGEKAEDAQHFIEATIPVEIKLDAIALAQAIRETGARVRARQQPDERALARAWEEGTTLAELQRHWLESYAADCDDETLKAYRERPQSSG